ncbi:hypothetical protein ACKAV7_014620 [Fusarium commune]
MKPQNVLLSHLLLCSAHALALPNGVHITLSGNESDTPDSSKKPINWTTCDLDFGEQTNALIDGRDEKLDCAKLDVPLDYTSLSTGATIPLQLIKIKATKKPFKGSVLYNPGGPGGSGVESIAIGGPSKRDILGGHYDLIGFDPRGTGRTIPFVCPSARSANSSALARRDFNTLPQSNTWDEIRTTVWKAAESLAEACYKDQEEHGRFISTPFTARDMISIVDALDQGPKINYWGTSYGTVLGQVFGSMFPDRIGRMLLDGNMPADDYATTTWISSSRDTERALMNLFNECVEAGPESCSLAEYSGKDTTGRDLMTAVNKLFDGLIGKSFPEEPSVTGDFVVAKMKAIIGSFLFSPKQFPQAIERILYALSGNWTGALTPPPAAIVSEWNAGGAFAVLGISCSDSSFRAETPDDLYSIYRAHLAQGSFADGRLSDQLYCSRWRFDAAEKINTNELRNVKTSFPVLFLNGIYDPVTPVSNVWEVSARFRDSRVLIYEGAGHGFTTHPSNCTNEAVRKYFDDGKLPEVGTTCKPNMSGYDYIEYVNEQEKAKNHEDRKGDK